MIQQINTTYMIQDRYNINVTKCTEKMSRDTNFQKPVKDMSLHIKDALN